MDIDIEPDKYVVAVSGGVDSMVLLDVLSKKIKDPKSKSQRWSLIVAHFDHGIRPESDEDRELVERIAQQSGLEFVSESGKLGPDASEAIARNARYDFLRRVMKDKQAEGIITAHHKDDVLETVIINLLRGTGRRGMVALRSRKSIFRPFLGVTKSEILEYASEHQLAWHEDRTNMDLKYRRNYIRHQILPKMTEYHKADLLRLVEIQIKLSSEIDRILNRLLDDQLDSHGEISRNWFIMLPHDVAREVVASWLRYHGITQHSSPLLERLVVATKTYKNGQQTDIDKNYVLRINSDKLAIDTRDTRVV